MKKVLLYLIIIAVGTAGVYYGLSFFNDKKTNEKSLKDDKKISKNNEEEEEVIPSRDAFISEAIKLQTLAENKENNVTCKCYNVKDLDKNTSLTGSILVYTLDDLFVSTMWLSNGYYILDGSENAATSLLNESDEVASTVCADDKENVANKSTLCSTNN